MTQTIPAGYKQTEIGVIPEDWEVLFLNELVSFENGDRSSNYPSASEFVDYGIPFINAGHVSDGHINKMIMDYVPEYVYNRLGGGKIKTGDLLFCLRGSLGKFGVVDNNFGRGAIASSLVIVRPNLLKTSTVFISTYFKSWFCRKMIDLWAGGAAQPNLGARELGMFLVPVPLIEEQAAIAEALSDVDALISEQEKLIAKKQAIKTATMQQLLTGKTRLPQFAHHPDGTPKTTKHTELGEIPEDWEVMTYGEIFTFLSTSTNSRADLSEQGEFGYVHYGDIHTEWNNRLDLREESLPRISKDLVSSEFVMDGDLIMADASEDYQGIGKSVEIFNVDEKRVVAGLHTFLLRDKNQKLADGYRGYLHSIPAVKRIFDRLATGMKVYGISKANLSTVCVPVSTLDEQTAISQILSDMDSEIQALEQRLNKTRQIKQGMMQQLLTGKIRLVKGVS
ncbi:restriction endonuclease subunit S [Thiomicrospira cyclica]|nr:restriction endonuclease subunit S [Thiomicrospira cyclica]